MKKISSFIGIGLLSAVLMSFSKVHECGPNAEDLKVGDISVVEIEEEIDLGFNSARYLPVGFNPYKGMILNLNDIVILGEEQEIDLGFDTAQYLPDGFNVCGDIEGNSDEIDTVGEEGKSILEFNEEDYLPENFISNAK
ncbi:hypothetical protein K8352_13470 [Flavobacteriaceae bacterium F89]|jgi:hypothetical protein|uniref:Uncharacterized protein n=1 Tax=Cerina litoralis TaxID=2874477 RepID=A0AAE3JTS5_9FLAO|nr:hypothetical protein [Cerina litoralis]MCG2461762.1 hypothetical protein [Cerina litoralis]